MEEGGGRGGQVPYSTGIYRNVKRQAVNNIIYMGNLVALMAWYTQIRRLFIGERFPQALYEGLLDTLHLAIFERIERFAAFCEKLNVSTQLYQQQMGDSASASLILQKDQLVNNQHQVVDLVRSCLGKLESYENKAFFSIIRRKVENGGSAYIEVIKSLDAGEALQGTVWLQRIVDVVTEQLLALFPSIR